MPRLSICVPTYKRAHLIRASLDTILQQTYGDFELIVVDNASPDNTEEVVRQIPDARVRYVRNPVNVGLILNNNRCIEEASGEVIAIYHDDDFYDRDLVRRSLEILDRNPRVGVVCCAVDIVDPHKPERVVERCIMPWNEVNPGQKIRRELLHRWDCPVPAPTVMVRRACYDKAGRWTDVYGGGADRELWLRILRDWDLGYINEPMASLRNRVKDIPSDPRAWSRDQWKQLTGQVAIERDHFKADLKDAPLRLVAEKVRIKTKASYELWRWGLLMLSKGNPPLCEPGPAAFREVGMKVSAMIYSGLQGSQVMQEGVRRFVRAYRYAAGNQ